MNDEVEHFRKKINFLTSEVLRVESLLAGAVGSPAKYSRLESELQQCKSDLQNAKQRLAELEGAQ